MEASIDEDIHRAREESFFFVEIKIKTSSLVPHQ
jgi:hypothetical protein